MMLGTRAILIGLMLAGAAAQAGAAETCFAFKTKTTEAFLNIELPKTDGTVSGTWTGTVQDDEQGYYTSWQSTIDGKRNGDQLVVKVETRIEDDLQKEDKIYELAKDGSVSLDGDRYEPLDCARAHPAE